MACFTKNVDTLSLEYAYKSLSPILLGNVLAALNSNSQLILGLELFGQVQVIMY